MILNPITESWINAYINRPQVAALINTNNDHRSGIEILNYIHGRLINSRSNPLQILDLEEGKSSIGIEQVRELHSSLSLSANKDHSISRVVGILNANKVTPDAQNALLKLLEELPERTIVILVTNGLSDILATIKSRCFLINVLPITKNQANEYGLSIGKDERTVNSAYVLSEGSYTRFNEYLIGDNPKSKENLSFAKDFISKSVFDRQTIVSKVTTKDFDSKEFLDYLVVTAKTGMRNSKSDNARMSWKNILKEVMTTQNQIKANVPKKIALLRLSVTLP